MLLTELYNAKAYKPTQHERMALAVALVVDSPQMAQLQLMKDPKLDYCAVQLRHLGFLQDDGEGGVIVTDAGYQLAQAQSLWDGSQPTQQAQQLAAVTNTNPTTDSTNNDF